MVLPDLDSGGLHFCDDILLELPAADPIQEKVHAHLCARTVRKRLSELLPDRPGPIDVGFEGDRLSGRSKRFEHRRKDLVAVGERCDVVPVEDGGTEKASHRAQELGVGDRVERRNPPLDLLFAAREVQDDDRDGRRCEHAERRDDNHVHIVDAGAMSIDGVKSHPADGR